MGSPERATIMVRLGIDKSLQLQVKSKMVSSIQRGTWTVDKTLFCFVFKLFPADKAGEEVCGTHWQATNLSGSMCHRNKEKRLCFKTSLCKDEHYKLTAVLSAAYHD